jgi:hypothetical protein
MGYERRSGADAPAPDAAIYPVNSGGTLVVGLAG